jgi:hypothetical protein
VNLGRFSSKQTVTVRARAANASAPLMTIAVANQQGPARIVLSEKTAFALRGTLVDDVGAPIASASLKLIMSPIQRTASPWEVRRALQEGSPANRDVYDAPVYQSDKVEADGTFSLTGWWPDVQYRLFAKLPGHERYASAILQAVPGKTKDLGRITLARTAEAVEGNVLDSAGKPVATARVFNAGDGPDPMETTTDAAGRFRLIGFRKGPAYVFAMADGYQFAGLPTTAGATDATIKMLRSDEPAPKRPIAVTPVPPEERKKLARALLEKAWDVAKVRRSAVGVFRQTVAGIVGAPADANDMLAESRTAILELMTTIDEKQAKRWAAEPLAKPSSVRPSNPQEAAQKALLETAEDDIDEAMSMLDKDPEQSVRQLHALTGHFATKDRDKALRCAEEGIVRARSLDQPGRTTTIVNWGEIVGGLGNKAAAKKLIEEAADTADRWKPNNRYDGAFATIALAVAPYNASRAVALLKKLSNEYYQRAYRLQVAAVIDDLKQVDALLKDADAASIKSVRTRWAYRVAPTSPTEAVRAIEGLFDQAKQGKHDTQAADDLTPCFARLAERIGTHDSTLACSLIDRSMAGLLRAKPAADEAAGNAAAAVQAARLAIVARKVGYHDMQGMVLRVLALRPTPGKSDSPLPAREATVALASALALSDPVSARPMLQILEPTADTIEDRSAWLQAWALADPRHAAELADKELARGKSSGDTTGSLAAVLAAVRLWTVSPDEQVKALLPDYGEETETGRKGVLGEGEMEMDYELATP